MPLLLMSPSYMTPSYMTPSFMTRSLMPFVAGIMFLLAAGGTSFAGPTAGEKIGTALARQIQTVLDGVAGTDRTAVGVEVTLSEVTAAGRTVNGSLRDLHGADGIQRLRIELTIDPKQDALGANGAIVEVDRSPNEVQALVSIVEKMSGLNRELGDELIVVTQSLSKVRDQNRQLAEAAKRAQQELEQQQFWKNIGINVAKIIGIVLAMILLRGAVRLIGRIGN